VVKWADKEAAIKALEKNGRVDPNDLIRAARDKDHPCHGDFTWDVDRAAEERWRDQARWLIRQCKFEVVVQDLGPRNVTYYVANEGKDDTFDALPKMRSASAVRNVLDSELASLHGIASRVLGIAEAKRAMVGDKTVKALREVCEIVEGIRNTKSL
jgi:hypothetical protein